MQFYFNKKPKNFWDRFKSRGSVIINFEKSFFGRGYTTKIECNEGLEREAEKIIILVSKAARQKHSESPYALSKEIEKELSEYNIYVYGTTFSEAWFNRGLKEVGISSLDEGDYKLLDY
jgi:hypothetical protein